MRVTLTKDLVGVRQNAIWDVRRQAEAQRMIFVSPGDGKAMAYQQKAAEAVDFLRALGSGEGVDPADYPHVFMEAQALGKTPEEMANLIVYLRRLWQQASAVIERVERTALHGIETSSSQREIEALRKLDWTDLHDLV